MAGIGFELKKIFLTSSKLKKTLLTFQSFLIFSGPWIISILTVVVVFLLKKNLVFNIFLSVIIYTFVFSLILSSSIVNLLTRYISDLLFSKEYEKLFPCFFSSSLITGLISFFISFYYIKFFTDINYLNFRISLLFTLMNLLWLTMMYVTILKDIKILSKSFLYGFFAIILLNFYYAKGNEIKYIDSFIIGIGIILFFLFKLIIIRFKFSKKLDFKWLANFKHYSLFFSGFFLYSGMWIDKILYWFFSKDNFCPIKGFCFLPQYDFATFLSYLTIIPASAYFMIFIETEFYEKQRAFLNILEKNGNLLEIKVHEKNIFEYFKRAMLKLSLFQIMVGIIFLILISPFINPFENNYLILITTVSATLQIILNIIIIFLYYFNSLKENLLLTFIFFLLNFVLTIKLKIIGLSYFTALLIVCFLAYKTAKYKFEKITYFILMESI